MSESARPDPDQLLARIQAAEEREYRAQFKIFFGASAGVGKTFAMLVEAHERRRAGGDVVVGLVETHGRRETATLLEGLETLPRRSLEYHGTSLEEFDLDAALARHPGLVLLDELAHTNAPGSRHERRWQDVEELLSAGIDVYTTLNVQHVESLIDVVAQITGVTVRETVPDSIVDRADVIELVDLPPDDLLQRLREGKVYVPEQARRALENFFRKGNLIALRELALRQTALRVDAQMESYRRAEGIGRPWAVHDRVVVGIGDPESGLRLVRAARRIAAALKAEWIVVHVETPGRLRNDSAVRDRIVDLMGLAQDLGAETAMLSGLTVAEELLAYAKSRNASRLLVGKPTRPRWRELVFGSLVSTLVRDSGDLDVYIIRGDESEGAPPPPAPALSASRRRDFVGGLVVVAACTLISWAMREVFAASNLVMIYLLGVVITAVAFGRAPAIMAAVLSVALFDFVFVSPIFTFAVSDTQYLVTFAVMLVVALLTGTLTARMREQTHAARQRERRTAALYQLSRELGGRRDERELLEAAAARISEVFECRVAFLTPGDHGRLAVSAGDAQLFGQAAHELGVAQWTFDHDDAAGLGTPTLPASRGLYVPLRGTSGVLGVLGLSAPEPARFHAPDRFQLLMTFANQTALALERARLSARAEQARVDAEAERMRNALLSSVSHDLRTPLAVITGAATSLRDSASSRDSANHRELLDTIAEEAGRLNRLVGELLDMTRLESGAVTANKSWHSLEEVVGAALTRLEDALEERTIDLRLPADLPLVPLDDVLIEQVLFNLLENAVKYTPAGSPIELGAEVRARELRIRVADRGPGFAPGEEERVFEKFYRASPPGEGGGVGLGLPICRAIVEAHGGRISAQNRPEGGAEFTIVLPIEGEPPAIEAESPDPGVAGGEEPSR